MTEKGFSACTMHIHDYARRLHLPFLETLDIVFSEPARALAAPRALAVHHLPHQPSVPSKCGRLWFNHVQSMVAL